MPLPGNEIRLADDGEVLVHVGDEVRGTGVGRSKKDAEQQAAANAYAALTADAPQTSA